MVGHEYSVPDSLVEGEPRSLTYNFIVTGKKSRFQPILPSWEAFDTQGIAELEDVKLMFGFTQITGGHYFGPQPSEINTAAELKRATAAALGRLTPQEQQLVSAKGWFRTHFVTKA
jgi:hypothetical protein